MNKSTKLPRTLHLGQQIKRLRKLKGMTQEELAKPEFTRGYVKALEAGTIRPSGTVLELLARRLQVPMAHFSKLSHAIEVDAIKPSLTAMAEDILYQSNYVKMLIRSGNFNEAMQLITSMEEYAGSHAHLLPGNVAYLMPFLRGRVYLQSMLPHRALPYLEQALRICGTNAEARGRVHNLLGILHFELDNPRLALEHHLKCVAIMDAGEFRDLNFRVNVCRNLANDYWALNQPHKALGVYREVLPYLDDLADVEQHAAVYWGMALAYMQSNDWPQARICAAKALRIYEETNNRSAAASICLGLAETMLEDERYEEASSWLVRGEHYLADVDDPAVFSYLYSTFADSFRRQGKFDDAAGYSLKSTAYAHQYLKSVHEQTDDSFILSNDASWQNPVRAYTRALTIQGLIEEERGNNESADHAFQQALTVLERGGFEETKYDVYYTYAQLLSKRNDYKNASAYFRTAAVAHADIVRSKRIGSSV